MARTKSMRPRAPLSGPAQRATRLLSTLGRPGPDEVAALLEGVDVAEALEASSYMSPVELANAAFLVFVSAHELTQTCTREQRSRLHGCSTRLVALALDQSLALYRGATERLERTRASEVAKQELAARLPTAEMQGKHAGNLLAKVAHDEVTVRLADLPTPCPVVDKLRVLADVARGLLDGAPANIATRMRLYGVDPEFVDGLDALVCELREKADLASIEIAEPNAALVNAHVATWTLAQHFVETFAVARQLDKTISALPWTPRRVVPPPSEARPHMPMSGARPVHAEAPRGPALRVPIALVR
jgi:hypothetical protein